MKHIKLKIFYKLMLMISTFSVLVISCERDDVCIDVPITPQLLIKFQDINDNSLAKRAPGLEVSLLSDPSRVVPRFVRFDSISIPLDTNKDTLRYVFTLNAQSTDQTIIRKDTLEFTYKRNNEYVSKACGFKTNFSELSQNFDIELQENLNWIKSISIINRTVNDETATHIPVFH